MRTQIQVSGRQNYGSCESCKATKQLVDNDEKQDDRAIKIKVSPSSTLSPQSLSKPQQNTTRGDPRLSSVLSNSAIVKKSWPPLTNKSEKKPGDDSEFDGYESKQHKKTVLQRAADTIPCLGILLALCASIFLGSAGMLVKMTRSVHGIQVAVLRAFIQLLIYGSVIKIRGIPFLPEAQEFMPVMGRALLGASSITCSYCALKLIPLGDATTIRFSLPIWTLIISYLVLNESCSLFKIFAVIISISGVILIAKPDECIYIFNEVLHALKFESDKEFKNHTLEYEIFKAEQEVDQEALPELNQPLRQFEGSLLALASSICLSLSLVALRLCKHTPAEITILWLSIISIMIGSITLVALSEWRLPNNWLDVLYIVLNGVCGSIGQWFITSALKIEQSGIISLARTFDIEVAFLYSAFVLHETIRISSIIGSILVSCGVVAVVVPKWLGSRKDDSETSDTVHRRNNHDDDDDDDDGSDDDVDVNVDINNNHDVKGNVNRCSECLAREAAQTETGAITNDKVERQ